MVNSNKKRVLFYRRLLTPTAGTNGGNLKLRDCFNHIANSANYDPHIYFSPDTQWYDNPGNHWNSLKNNALKKWDIKEGDVLFFSGLDWDVLPESQRHRPPVPVINIVQPRHARPMDVRNAFLKHPAIRIAKSETGAKILRAHGVNGPLFVIPDAIDLGLLPPVPKEKDIDVLILGLKQPQQARAVFENLNGWAEQEGLNIRIEIQLPPPLSTRMDFLNLLSRAKIAVCIPLEDERGAEGFYLPALEAMALEALVVCPHAVGNKDHCIDSYNCIVPDANVESITAGAKQAILLDERQSTLFLENGRKTAQNHSIEQERLSILNLLDNAKALWADQHLFTNQPKPKMAMSFFEKMKTFFHGQKEEEKVEHLDIVLTGVPRSGTTLCCHLLNKLPNMVALNEPIMVGRLRSKEAALNGITDFYRDSRITLIHEGTAIARATEDGVPDNNFAATGNREAVVKKQRIHFDKPLDESMTLAVKHNAFFTILLDEVRQDYPTYAIIRNPLAVLGSWNSVDIPAAKGRVRAAEWLAPDMVTTLEKIPDRYDKQIYIMDWYFKRYLSLPREDVLKYEVITATNGLALEKINPAAAHLKEKLSSKNKSSLYSSDIMKMLVEKLTQSDLACWEFYDRKEVELLVS